MSHIPGESKAKRRILNTAYDLFYRQGFHATGINQLIAEAGVTKATFYNHFASKDDLLTSYVRDRDRIELGIFLGWLDENKEPISKFLAPLEKLFEWLSTTDFRGCTFQNIATELVDRKHPAWAYVENHTNSYLRTFREITLGLKESDPARFENLDVEKTAQSYFMVFQGTLALAKIHRSDEPVKQTLKTVKEWIGEK